MAAADGSLDAPSSANHGGATDAATPHGVASLQAINERLLHRPLYAHGGLSTTSPAGSGAATPVSLPSVPPTPPLSEEPPKIMARNLTPPPPIDRTAASTSPSNKAAPPPIADSATSASSTTRLDAALPSSLTPPSTEDLGSVSPAETLEATIAKLQARCADLAGQVTSLNGKLVQSYNRVGGLEDDLHSKVEMSSNLQKEVERLESQRKEWEDKYEGGLLVEKDHVQAELSRMMDQVIQETASRGKAEKDKATIEKELAELSSQLFQEANQMVALERMQRLRAESKMNQLEQNLKDTESMMSGQSEQMRGLGGKLEEIEHERDELKKQVEEAQAAATAAAQSAAAISRPYQPTPGNQFTSPPDANNNAVPGTPGGGYRSLQQAAMTIKHPLQYLALDVQPYFEFVVFTKGMARIRKNIVDRRYMNSISESGGMTPGIGSFASAYGQSSSAGHGAHTVTSPKMTQYQSMILKQDQAEALAEALPLSQYTSFPFLKRAQDEDLVATLHLDDAPGLSFFSRGKISNAIIDGQLAIEPAYISLPSDQCCLCGSSLQRFIASHQSTAPKEDPRKKLTRLATGWIPGSGNSTPIKDAQGFTMSALSSALEALTPAKELAGFSFGMSSSNDTSTQNKRLSMSAGPGAGNNNVLSGPRPRDSERNALSASVGASGRPSTGDGSTTSFPLIAAARQNAQVYLFRTQDSDTKYAICPTYCLPRLRAVCDLFTYIRTIQRGLLMEDAPKFLAPAAVSEYGQHTRRLSNQMPPMSATAARGGFATPLATPMLNANRQLVAPAENMKPAGNGNGGASSSTNGSTSTGGTAGLGLTSESTNEAGPVTGLGLDIQKKDFAFTSQNPSTSSLFSEDGTANSSSTAPTSTASSMDGQSAEGQSVAASDRGPSRRPSVEVQTPDGHHKPLVGNDTVHTPAGDQPFKLVLPPSRPRRNTDRPGPSAPGTPTMPSGETVSAVASASSSVPQTQQKSEAPPNAQSTADQPAAAPTAPTSVPVATSAPTMAPPPTSATGNAPPRLPPRNASQQSVNTGSAPRLPTRPPLSKLSTSMSGTTPGSLMAASAAGAAVSASAAGWQEKCWFEVVRLKEATFWTRVGSQYTQH